MKVLFGATMAGPGPDAPAAGITLATKDFISTQKGKARCCELY